MYRGSRTYGGCLFEQMIFFANKQNKPHLSFGHLMSSKRGDLLGSEHISKLQNLLSVAGSAASVVQRVQNQGVMKAKVRKG